jgi:hypothetical protein
MRDRLLITNNIVIVQLQVELIGVNSLYKLLALKPGCPLMLLHNIDTTNNLYN